MRKFENLHSLVASQETKALATLIPKDNWGPQWSCGQCYFDLPKNATWGRPIVGKGMTPLIPIILGQTHTHIYIYLYINIYIYICKHTHIYIYILEVSGPTFEVPGMSENQPHVLFRSMVPKKYIFSSHVWCCWPKGLPHHGHKWPEHWKTAHVGIWSKAVPWWHFRPNTSSSRLSTCHMAI